MNYTKIFESYLNEMKLVWKKGDTVSIKPEFIEKFPKQTKDDKWEVVTEKGSIAQMTTIRRLTRSVSLSQQPTIKVNDDMVIKAKYKKLNR